MKIVAAAIAAATALAAVAVAPASAQPYGPPGYHHDRGRHHGYDHRFRHPPRRICVYRHHREVCRWVR